MIRNFVAGLAVALGLAGCASAPYSTIVSQPAAPLKTMYVIVEQSNNVVFDSHAAPAAASSERIYDRQFTAYVNRDMARVFKENGIDAKVAVIPAGTLDIRGFLQKMSAADHAQWKSLLWIHHSDGSYSSRGLLYLHLESLLVDTGTGRLLWKAHGGSDAPAVDETRWANGEVYRTLLTNLAKDKMIVLPAETPAINIP